jgi:hypothetical protein
MRINMPSNMTIRERMAYMGYLHDLETMEYCRQQQQSITMNMNVLLRQQSAIQNQYLSSSERVREFVTTYLNREQPADAVEFYTFTVPEQSNAGIGSIFTRLSQFLNSRVTVRPTQEQIDTATETLMYRDLSGNTQTTCPIDMSEFTEDDDIMRIRHCGHIFREENLTRWFETNVACPVCRYDIRNYITDISGNSIEN